MRVDDGRRAGLTAIAVGAAILMCTLTVVNIENAGLLDDLWLGDVITAVAASSLLLIVAGLTVTRQVLQWGFLAACVTYLLRCSFVLLTSGAAAQGVWLSLGAAVMLAGAFLTAHWHRQAR